MDGFRFPLIVSFLSDGGGIANLDDLEGAKEEASVASLVRVANEVGVKLLVTFKGDSSLLLVIIVQKLVISIIELLDGLVGHPLNTVASEFVDSNGAVTININGFEKAVNECFESGWELGIALAHAIVLNGFFKLISGDLTILVEVSKFSNFSPEVGHDLLVFLEDILAPLSLGLNDGVANGQALEVVLVQEAVVVNVVHVPDDELDTVIPAVCHLFS